jgi:hypothetical protein
MDTEMIKAAIQEAIREGFTPASWIAILVGLFLAPLGAFAGSYFKTRAEQRAAKENFNEVLRQIKGQTKATEGIKAELSGKLWIGQKQWELTREIYKNMLEVVDETLGVMQEVKRLTQWGPVPIGAPADEAARLKKQRDDITEDARAKIAGATRKLHQTAVFSQVVLSEDASRALRQLVDMLEEQGDEDPEGYLPIWTRETARIESTNNHFLT